MNQMLKIMKLADDAILPSYKTPGSAGFDLHVLLADGEYDLDPGEICLFSTGLAFGIPEGYEVQIRSRSGLALKGIVVANSPGTVDSDFTGEIKVILTNISSLPFNIKHHDRVAQGVFSKVEIAYFQQVFELSNTERGDGGFGSTGRN